MLENFRAVIFDIDGTLLDSNDAHARSFQRAFEENGMSFDYYQIRNLIGMGGDHLLPTLSGIQDDSPQGKQIAQRKKEIFRSEYLPYLKPFPQARELVKALHEKKIRVAIATSAKKDELKDFLKIIEIEDFIEVQACSDDAESSKPSPDILSAALQKLNLHAREAVMVGDTPFDIEAARRAGMETIAFLSGGRTRSDLKNALAILEGPAELLDRI